MNNPGKNSYSSKVYTFINTSLNIPVNSENLKWFIVYIKYTILLFFDIFININLLQDVIWTSIMEMNPTV